MAESMCMPRWWLKSDKIIRQNLDKMVLEARNIKKCLVISDAICSSAMPRACYIVVSKNIFQRPYNKTSLSCGTSFTSSKFLAELQGRLALSVVYIALNFIPCQELMKLAVRRIIVPLLYLYPKYRIWFNPFSISRSERLQSAYNHSLGTVLKSSPRCSVSFL